MRIISVLVVLLLFGCGSRKVDKSESIQVIEQQSVKDVKNDLELSVKDSFVNRYVNKNSRFKATEIKIEKDGSVVISNPVIEAVEETKESNGVVETKLTDKGKSEVKESINTSVSEKVKNVDREQYSFGWLIPLVLVVGMVVWKLGRKYLNF